MNAAWRLASFWDWNGCPRSCTLCGRFSELDNLTTITACMHQKPPASTIVVAGNHPTRWHKLGPAANVPGA